MSKVRRPRRISAIITSAAVIGALLWSVGSASGATAVSAPAPIDHQVRVAAGLTSAIVHVKPEAALVDGLQAARSVGARTGTTYDAINVFVAYGTASSFDRLAKASAIEYIEANRKLKMFTNSSHIATRGQDVLNGDIKLADGTVIDGTGVGVAVVDSGIDGTHPDLTSRMGGNVKIICSTPQPVATSVTGFTQCLGPKQVVPLEDTDTPSAGGHGTHVAGIVAGTGRASGGLYHGAAPGATLYGVSVGTAIAVENGLDGLNWVLENHDQVNPPIKVVNNSWGGDYSKYDPQNASFHKALWQLQDALIADGVSVVFANGNAGGDGSASTTSGECVNPTPGLVCVANYNDNGIGTRNGTINSGSSRGKSNVPLEWPDISAPGTNIISTCRVTLPVCTAGSGTISNENNYRSLSGTSMAAPHIAGIIAQLYQADPTLTPAKVENILEDTAYKFQSGSPYGLFTDPTNPDNTSSFEKGHGLVDVLSALHLILDPPDPNATPTPTPIPSVSPSPTAGGPSGPTTTYYFHSESGDNTVDLLTGGAVYDTSVPIFGPDEFSSAHDFSPAQNTTLIEYMDPTWRGTIAHPATSIKVDFWGEQLPDAALGEGHYTVRVLPAGATSYIDLLPLIVLSEPGAGPINIKQTFTEMKVGTGAATPLELPAGELTFSIRGTFADSDLSTEIFFDSTNYMSSFTVNPV